MVALVLALVWNGLLLWRFAIFVYAAFNTGTDDGADKVSAYIEQVAKVSSFLVSLVDCPGHIVTTGRMRRVASV